MNKEVKVVRKRKYEFPAGFKIRKEHVRAGFQTMRFSPDGRGVEIHSENGQIPAVKIRKEQPDYKMTIDKGEPLYAVVIRGLDPAENGKQYLAYGDRTPVWVKDIETKELIPFWNYIRPNNVAGETRDKSLKKK
jgi:hypothetical protein